jgi:O-antigen/teichoic acid export membrane protein
MPSSALLTGILKTRTGMSDKLETLQNKSSESKQDIVHRYANGDSASGAAVYHQGVNVQSGAKTHLKASMDGDISFRFGTMQIMKGAGWFGVGTAGGMVLEYLTQGVLASRLGPANFGLYSTGFQFYSFALVLAALALPNAISHYIPRYESDGRAVDRIISTSFWIALGSGLLVSVLLFLFAEPFAALYSNEPQLASVIRLYALALPGMVLVSVLLGVLRGLKRSRQASLLTSTHERLLRLGFTLLFLFMGFGLQGAALAFLPASLCLLLLAIYQLKKAGRRMQHGLSTFGRIEGFLGYTWPVLVSQLLARATSMVQPLLLLYFLDARAVGIFTVARFVPQAFSMVLGAFNFLYFPVISSTAEKGDLRLVRRMYRLTTSWSLLIIWPAYLMVMSFPEVLLNFFGAAYEPGVPALRLLATGALINVGSGMVGSTLLATGKTRIYLIIEVVGVAASFGLAYLLIPVFGLTGAAISGLAAGALWNIACLLSVYKLWGIQPFDIQYLRILLIGLVLLVPVYSLTRLLIEISPIAVIGMGGVFLLLTITVLARFRLLNKDSLTIVNELVKVSLKMTRSIINRLKSRFGWSS